MVHPLAIGHRVVDAQPDVLLWADALTHVVVELVVLVPCQRRAQTSPLGEAVGAGCAEGLLHRVGQETLAEDLGASQTNFKIQKISGAQVLMLRC